MEPFCHRRGDNILEDLSGRKGLVQERGELSRMLDHRSNGW